MKSKSFLNSDSANPTSVHQSQHGNAAGQRLRFQPFSHRSWRAGKRLSCLKIACLLLVTVIGVSGCVPPSDPTLDLIDTDLQKTKIDDLAKTMDFVFSERRFEQKEFESKISTGLNRWVRYSADKVSSSDWTLDSKIQPLVDEYADLAVLKQTDEFSFVNTDAYFLQESSWVDQVVQRVVKSKQLNAFELYRLAADDFKSSDEKKDPVVELIKVSHPDLDEAGAVQLASTFKLFDWVVRNIQLTPEADNSDSVDELRLNDSENLIEAGVLGTGYTRFPWQTLLYSRGDYVDRAKVMMVGLQGLEIDSVMLGVNTEDDESPTPWVVAVPIGDEYYLFDTKLALPIPGERLGSFATLSEVRANGKLVDGLDLTVEESISDNTKYWVRSNQLKDLKALVYVSPESVSKRMQGLESRLIGDARLALVTRPSEVMGRLPKADGLEFEVWDIAFKTHQFRQAVREALENRENNELVERLRWHYDDEAYVDGFTRYRTSRSRFFKGKFISARMDIGYNAIESFEKLMYTDATVDSLATNQVLQRQLGILKSAGQDANDFQRQLRSVQAQMRLVRRDTGFFLAQCHFDNGSVSAAANWLKLLSEKEDADRWFDGIDYLLGRAIEGRKEYDLAIEAYQERKDIGTQSHGNLIRARLLGELIKKLDAEFADSK